MWLTLARYKSEGAPAFAAVVDLFQSETLREVVRSLDPVWVDEISRLMPEWSGEEHKRIDTATILDGSQPQRHQLFEALTRACIGNRNPILLHIDDVHWCDSETLAWLHFLLRFDTAAPLLVLVTARPEDTAQHETLGTLIRALRKENLLTEIVVEPLERKATALLAAHLIGQHQDTNSISTLYSRDGGESFVYSGNGALGTWIEDWNLQGRERMTAHQLHHFHPNYRP